MASDTSKRSPLELPRYCLTEACCPSFVDVDLVANQKENLGE